MKRTITLIAVSFAMAALLTPGPALAQPVAGLRCPDDGLSEVRRQKPVPDLVTALIPPLAILNILGNDSLAKAPTHGVQFRVVDEAGKSVPNALVGLIYEKHNRFLAEGAAGGAAIRIPHGKYIVNAAAAGKDRSLRYGSTAVTIDAKGPATVTVKLTGRAEPLALKAAVSSAVVGSHVPIELTGGIPGASTLAVMRPGGKVRGAEGAEDTFEPQSQAEDGTHEVTLPARVGKYDIVAMLCAPRITLARTTVTAESARVVIEAPDRAPMGSVLRVVVTGNLNRGHGIAIGPVDAMPRLAGQFGGEERSVFELKLPYEPGTYEIKVTTGRKAVLARRKVIVDEVPLSITGPESIRLGEQASFAWPDQTENKFRLEVWTLARAGKPAERLHDVRDKRAIAGPGEYELRLVPWSRSDGRVLGRKPFRVEGTAFVRPPSEAVAGTRITAEIAIDVQFFDKLYFFERGSATDYHSSINFNHSSRTRVMTVDVPKRPGSYDLVYMIGAVGERVEAGRVPVEVRAQGEAPKPNTATGGTSGREKEQDACCSNPVGAAFDALKPATKGEMAK
jgi:hypothetical protein